VKTYTIAVLPGDGIGPEVIAEAERALEAAGDRFGIEFTLRRFPVGAAGVAAAGDPLPEVTREAVTRADAVLLGAVGDPALDKAPHAGCSMCLGMNPDVLQSGERCASTSNRNFEGRQGRGGRTHLMSPPMAAAAAVAGHIVDVRKWAGDLAAR